MDNNNLKNLGHHLFLSIRRVEWELLGDKQLLRRYTGLRDELALGEIVRRHGPLVWGVCRRILGRCRDADDVYQVTFLKLVLRAAFVQRYESTESWLHTVAHDTAVTAKLKRDRQRAGAQRREKMCEEGYIDPQDTKDLAEILDDELGYLPEKYRSPLILCYMEGLAPEQAARRINISTPCLKRRLAEGRKRLHQRLCQRGIHLDSPMLVAGLTSDLHSSQQEPPGLMEKTLDMVRIVTQSNSALESASISGEVTLLTHKVWETWTLKAKFLLVLLLTVLVVAGGGMITYSSWLSFDDEQHQKSRPGPAKKLREMPETHETQSQRTNRDRIIGDLYFVRHRFCPVGHYIYPNLGDKAC